MIDATRSVHFVSSHMLLVEPAASFPLRFNQVVMIARVVRHYGGGVELLSNGQHYDASSVFSILQSVGATPTVRRFAFVGEEAPLRDLSRLCRHFLSEGHPQSAPAELEYLKQLG